MKFTPNWTHCNGVFCSMNAIWHRHLHFLPRRMSEVFIRISKLLKNGHIMLPLFIVWFLYPPNVLVNAMMSSLSATIHYFPDDFFYCTESEVPVGSLCGTWFESWRYRQKIMEIMPWNSLRVILGVSPSVGPKSVVQLKLLYVRGFDNISNWEEPYLDRLSRRIIARSPNRDDAITYKGCSATRKRISSELWICRAQL